MNNSGTKSWGSEKKEVIYISFNLSSTFKSENKSLRLISEQRKNYFLLSPIVNNNTEFFISKNNKNCTFKHYFIKEKLHFIYKCCFYNRNIINWEHEFYQFCSKEKINLQVIKEKSVIKTNNDIQSFILSLHNFWILLFFYLCKEKISFNSFIYLIKLAMSYLGNISLVLDKLFTMNNRYNICNKFSKREIFKYCDKYGINYSKLKNTKNAYITKKNIISIILDEKEKINKLQVITPMARNYSNAQLFSNFKSFYKIPPSSSLYTSRCNSETKLGNYFSDNKKIIKSKQIELSKNIGNIKIEDFHCNENINHINIK